MAKDQLDLELEELLAGGDDAADVSALEPKEMNDHPIEPPAPKRRRRHEAAPEPVQVIITDAPVVNIIQVSAQTRAEMEEGRRALARNRGEQ